MADQAIRGFTDIFCFSYVFLFMNYIRTKTVASSSLIQTLLSVPEFHRIGHITWFADYTAGREFRPAPKNLSEYQYTIFYFRRQ